MESWKEELYHHGIRGQQWGVKNGPPYPLKGEQYSRTELREYHKHASYKDLNNKKHFDRDIKKGTDLSTLSYDPNRTKDTDMFYAAYTFYDKHSYNVLFNKKVYSEIFDENGNSLGNGDCYKFKIENTLSKDVKVASEDSGAKAFSKLYENDRDFCNFVKDPSRLQKLYETSPHKHRVYDKAVSVLERMRDGNVTDRDLHTVYRLFNYVIPNDGSGNKQVAKDVRTQRAKFFTELKKNGYSACLDTNDAIYNGLKAESPVIVFDMSVLIPKEASRITVGSKAYSTLVYAGTKILTQGIK